MKNSPEAYIQYLILFQLISMKITFKIKIIRPYWRGEGESVDLKEGGGLNLLFLKY